MTVKELIERLESFNCPDYEIMIAGKYPTEDKYIRFSESGTKIDLGCSAPSRIKDLQALISELKDESDDMYNSVEALYAIIDDLEELYETDN